ncbi:MAG TPA: helix-turn-helix transcriptional regulator [Chthoniobacterales bacterium]|nr:helix-turn-helix transcriptional regulator [Chthoniobacterales bacterium]
MNLGDYIKKLRVAADLTHDQLAKKADVHRNTVTNLESGQPIRFDNLRSILNALRLPPKDWGRAAMLWVREQVGRADFDRIAGADAARKLVIEEQAELSEAAKRLADRLSEVDQSVRDELIKAADRPEIIECVRILNAFHDKTLAEASSRSRDHRVLYEEIEQPGSAPRVRESSKSAAGSKRSRKPGGRSSGREKA